MTDKAPARDIDPQKDVFTVVIIPTAKKAKERRILAQLRPGGLLYWPGEERAIEHEGKALKIGKNEGCVVTLA